ncbi:MAG: acylphosphatase [Candidatus Thermoplasmatota archaeon]|nr:acylphosphatase [Candidatus Thermoplasmatota archaeon]
MITNVHIFISGHVQGVWFRASTKQKAEQLGLKGWVRNTNDGYVEAVFQGDDKQVKEMINWCHQGPPLAKVEKVNVTKKQSIDILKDFSIKH